VAKTARNVKVDEERRTVIIDPRTLMVASGVFVAAITNPTTYSYKRLVPDCKAPVYVAWSRANRSACIRVPAYYRGSPKAAKSKRVEYRPPRPVGEPLPELRGHIGHGA
jgi:hypothetical protein